MSFTKILGLGLIRIIEPNVGSWLTLHDETEAMRFKLFEGSYSLFLNCWGETIVFYSNIIPEMPSSIFASFLPSKQQTPNQLNVNTHPGAICGNESFLGDIRLSSCFKEDSHCEDNGEESGYSYKNVQGSCITPRKLFICAVFFLAGMIIIAKSMTGGFRFGWIGVLIGGGLMVVFGVAALPW